MLNYCGGIPEMPKKESVALAVVKENLNVVHGWGKTLSIPIESIKSATIKTSEQVSKDVTLTRVLLLGVFALGAKKKTKTETDYLIVEYMNGNVPCKAIFTGPESATLCSQISTAMMQYKKAEPNKDEPIVDEAPSDVDVAAQIEKFHALKEKGIITEEEFNAKKAQLLGL